MDIREGIRKKESLLSLEPITSRIEDVEYNFYPVRPISSLLRNGREYFGTMAYTVDQLNLLLQRAVELRYPKIKIRLEEDPARIQKDEESLVLLEYLSNREKSELNVAMESSYPINNIVAEIHSHGLLFSMLAEQSASFNGKHLAFQYPSKIWIDRFAISNWVPGFQIDIRNIFKAVYDFCIAPTSLEITFHMLEIDTNQCLVDMIAEYGDSFQEKDVLNTYSLHRKYLQKEYEIMKQNFVNSKTLSPQLQEILGKVRKRLYQQ